MDPGDYRRDYEFYEHPRNGSTFVVECSTFVVEIPQIVLNGYVFLFKAHGREHEALECNHQLYKLGQQLRRLLLTSMVSKW
jgi:hypothetical protein